MINPHPLLTIKGTPRNHIHAPCAGIILPVCLYLVNTPSLAQSPPLLTLSLDPSLPQITLPSSLLPEQDFKQLLPQNVPRCKNSK